MSKVDSQNQSQEVTQQAADPDLRPNWSKIKRLNANSLASRRALEKWSVIREFWRAHQQMVTYYMQPEGGGHSLEDAIKPASEEVGEGGMAEERLKLITSLDVDALSWGLLDRVFRSDPSYAQQLWEEVKEQALTDFMSGHFAAELFERTDWQKDVWKRAPFVVIYEEMVAGYQPRDAIEHSMVEMVAVHYFLWQHWVRERLQRATTEPRRESCDYQKWREREKEVWCKYSGQRRPIQGQWIAGAWELPYQSEAEAVQHALEMADRCRRAYHASVRALRDWRRYNMPVIVNNPGQVNIAADGGQQVNIQGKARKKKVHRLGPR